MVADPRARSCRLRPASSCSFERRADASRGIDFLLRIPVIGELVRKQAIVRTAIVMSTMLKSGVVFVRAVQIAQRDRGQHGHSRRADSARTRRHSRGRHRRSAGRHCARFRRMVVQMFALGQQSGRLEEMLDRLAHTYDQQLATGTQRLAAILEPVLILLLALIVLFIVLATVLPILEAGNVVA